MTNVEVYTKDYCPYCTKAMNLLTLKGIEFVEIDITNDADKMQEMLTRAAPRRTVPQIFINGQAIGGCDDLYALDSNGKLEGLIRNA